MASAMSACGSAILPYAETPIGPRHRRRTLRNPCSDAPITFCRTIPRSDEDATRFCQLSYRVLVWRQFMPLIENYLVTREIEWQDTRALASVTQFYEIILASTKKERIQSDVVTILRRGRRDDEGFQF